MNLEKAERKILIEMKVKLAVTYIEFYCEYHADNSWIRMHIIILLNLPSIGKNKGNSIVPNSAMKLLFSSTVMLYLFIL